MGKVIKWIIIIAVLGGLAYGWFVFFYDVKKSIVDYNNEVTLNMYDYAEINNEFNVKLIYIKDELCHEKTCEREGQYVVGFLLNNSKHINYVWLGSVGESEKEIKDFNSKIKLVNTTDKEVTIKVTRMDD